MPHPSDDIRQSLLASLDHVTVSRAYLPCGVDDRHEQEDKADNGEYPIDIA
jgi:hypothetical protein